MGDGERVRHHDPRARGADADQVGRARVAEGGGPPQETEALAVERAHREGPALSRVGAQAEEVEGAVAVDVDLDGGVLAGDPPGAADGLRALDEGAGARAAAAGEGGGEEKDGEGGRGSEGETGGHRPVKVRVKGQPGYGDRRSGSTARSRCQRDRRERGHASIGMPGRGWGTPSAERVTACPFGGSTVNGAASVRRQLSTVLCEPRSKNAGRTKSLTATPLIS